MIFMENVVFIQIMEPDASAPDCTFASIEESGSTKPNLKTVKKVGVFLRWLPMMGSVTLMVVVSIVSACSFSQLKTANSWREDTYKVLAAAQTLDGIGAAS